MSNRADRFTVVLDANVLVGALSRNMLLSLAEAGFFRPRWSEHIQDEFERAFDRLYQDKDLSARQRMRMETAFPEASVNGYDPLIDAINLRDKDDRHVVAAAVQTKAGIIVTENLKDFDPEELEKFEIEAISLDDFIADLLDLAGTEAVAALRAMRERFKRPEITADALIARVEELGLLKTADILNEYREVL